jgi:hypothetical protein
VPAITCSGIGETSLLFGATSAGGGAVVTASFDVIAAGTELSIGGIVVLGLAVGVSIPVAIAMGCC